MLSLQGLLRDERLGPHRPLPVASHGPAHMARKIDWWAGVLQDLGTAPWPQGISKLRVTLGELPWRPVSRLTLPQGAQPAKHPS